MAAVTSRKSLSLFLKDLEHSFDKFLCIFNVEFVSEPDRMFVTHPISLLVFKLIFLHRGFSCTSWSHPRNVTVVGYALTAHWCPEKWQNSRHCLSLGEKHLKHGRKAEFLWSHQQHLRETCMPQVLTLFFNFFFFLSSNYVLDSGGEGRAWIRSKMWTKWHGQDFLPLGSVCVCLWKIYYPSSLSTTLSKGASCEWVQMKNKI